MQNFEKHCHKINMMINIGADRSPKTMADEVLCYMTDTMKKLDPAFNSMYRGFKISGSYADDLKISHPNEFDFVLTIKLPLLKQCQLTKTIPGYVKIDAAHLRNIRNQPNQEHIMKVVQTFIDPNGCLLKTPFASWIHWQLDKVFDGLQKLPARGKYLLQKNGNRYEISRSRSGPAHTLNVAVVGRALRFDIDLVFVLELENCHWVSDRRIDTHLMQGRWNLVPKPYTAADNADGDTYWICSYAEVERQYLNGRNHMKGLIRMFKKIRDTHGLSNLKSFYIKTVFMLHDVNVSRTYWNGAWQKLFFEMFRRLVDHIERKSLPSFWDSEHNLFATLTNQQWVDLVRKVQGIERQLIRAVAVGDWDALTRVILPQSECQRMLRGSPPELVSAQMSRDDDANDLDFEVIGRPIDAARVPNLEVISRPIDPAPVPAPAPSSCILQ